MKAAGFTEREPFERGFAEVFRREIVPHLDGLERGRRQARARTLVRLGAVLAAMVAVVALAGILLEGAIVFLFVLVILAIVFGGLIVRQPARAFGSEVRAVVMPPVCRFFGDMEYRRDAQDAFALHRFAETGVVGRFNRSRLEDLFVGRYRDTGFMMAEAVLRRRSGGGRNRSTRTVFRGLLFVIDVPHPFAGRVLLGREHGWLGNKVADWAESLRGLQRVPFAHEAFESLYQVYADDPATAQTLLSPPFLDSLVALAEAHRGRALRAAFIDGVFLLSVPMRRDLFEPASIFRPVYTIEADLHRLLLDVTIVHRVIDFLHGDRPASLT
jgi:hypothetical protein